MLMASWNTSQTPPLLDSMPPCVARRSAFWKASALMMLVCCSAITGCDNEQGHASLSRPLHVRMSDGQIAEFPAGTTVAQVENAIAIHERKGKRAPSRSDFVEDDPRTTNDESNDQPLGSRGNTMCVGTPHNGRKYRLDADLEDDFGVVRSLYFPKGGNVDFENCVVDADFLGECEDESGKTWEFEGVCEE